jgi:transposase-like protein
MKAVCKWCGGEVRKRGFDRLGKQRYYCAKCYQSFILDTEKKGHYNRINRARPEIERALTANMPIRNIARIFQISTNTIAKIKNSKD